MKYFDQIKYDSKLGWCPCGRPNQFPQYKGKHTCLEFKNQSLPVTKQRQKKYSGYSKHQQDTGGWKKSGHS